VKRNSQEIALRGIVQFQLLESLPRASCSVSVSLRRNSLVHHIVLGIAWMMLQFLVRNVPGCLLARLSS